MLTKEYVTQLKNTGAIAEVVLENKENIGAINTILEKLGHLPKGFNVDFLYKLMRHNSASVRLNAVKNIAKMSKDIDVNFLLDCFKLEKDTSVKREIVSAIGRQRSAKNKSILFEMLRDEDPKIVCQAIRALLVFNDEEVELYLKPLVNHQNEMVRTVIYKEFFAKDVCDITMPHAKTYEFLKNVVVHADVLDALKSVPNESIHLTFTSPPYYNARDYSIYPSYQAYLEFLEQVFIETHRVTKEGRFLIINTSPIIIPRVSRSHSSRRYGIPFDLHAYIVKNGWEFVDDIVWLKPEASVKNRIGGFMQHRKPLGYKPNCVTEYLMVYRKKTEKLLDWNIRSYDPNTVEQSKVADDFEKTNVWRIDPCFSKVHSAVFPVELCRRVIQYYSYKGDLVFDPFGGSGTVGRTAKSLGRYFFLTEKDDGYFDYMRSKVVNADLFGEKETLFLDLETFNKSVK